MRVMHSADRTMFTFFTNSAIRKKTCEVDSKIKLGTDEG